MSILLQGIFDASCLMLFQRRSTNETNIQLAFLFLSVVSVAGLRQSACRMHQCLSYSHLDNVKEPTQSVLLIYSLLSLRWKFYRRLIRQGLAVDCYEAFDSAGRHPG